MRTAICVVTGLILAAGCSAPPAAAPQAPAVGWVERVCRAMVVNGARLSQLPAVDLADPVAAKEGLLAFLKTLSESLTAVEDGISAAGAPPVVDGEAAVSKALAGIDGARTSVESARTRLAEASAVDAEAFRGVVVGLGSELEGLAGSGGPLRDLRENGEIDDAYREAGGCRELDGVI
ncbi:hypothetical protein LV75_006840 [Actinokineospora diospyrosa]|uniref:Small secreted protein n=1 Tax=Actinokineospora diospyrosa TaxID=103728 RepID=A0ABT1IQ76_9PSEU|nr:hypothetical protein [Actinokineospora diospyrosa]